MSGLSMSLLVLRSDAETLGTYSAHSRHISRNLKPGGDCNGSMHVSSRSETYNWKKSTCMHNLFETCGSKTSGQSSTAKAGSMFMKHTCRDDSMMCWSDLVRRTVNENWNVRADVGHVSENHETHRTDTAY